MTVFRLIASLVLRLGLWRLPRQPTGPDQSFCFDLMTPRQSLSLAPKSRNQWPQTVFVLAAAVIFLVPTALAAAEPNVTATWYLIRFDEKPVGYEHLTVGPTHSSGSAMVNCVRRTRIQLKRLGKDITLESTLSTVQTVDGVLQKFDLLRLDGDGSRTERRGEYDPAKGVFHINQRVNLTRRDTDLRVSKPVRSPVFSVWLPGMIDGSTRRISIPVLFPETGDVAQVTADLRPPREIRTGGISRTKVKQIRFYPQLDPIKSTTLLVSDDGQILLQERSLLGRKLTLEFTTPETALTAVANRSLNLDIASIIPVDRLLPSSGNSTRLVVDLTVKNGVLKDIPQSGFQKTERLSESTIRVTLTRPVMPRRGIRPASRQKPPLQALTHWLPLQDKSLQRMAAVAAAGQNDPAEICRRTERYVHSKLNHSAFSTQLMPADQIARSLRGDCTEHAVLLAALLRIKGIPSRIATGLVPAKNNYGFVGHAWVEAWIEGLWVPFDSTIGSEGVGISHIKLTDSELTDDMTGGISLFLPILDLTGRASLHIVSDK